MKAKLITLFAAALIVVGALGAVALASPDKNSNDKSGKNEKQLKIRDKSLDKVRGTHDGSKGDRRQDARIGDEKSWDDAGYDDSKDGSTYDDSTNDSSKDGNPAATTLTSFDSSKDEAKGHDGDRRYKEGTKADRRGDRDDRVVEIVS